MLVCIYRHAFRDILGFFYPPCLYLGDKTCFMINMFSHMDVSAILFFMPCPEPPMVISGVGSFPVQSGDSLIFFPAL